MGRWQTTLLSGAIVLVCGFTVLGCTTTAQSSVPITFAGKPPAWADTATTVMADLEQWRGLDFQAPLHITFQSQGDPNLNGWYDSETKQLVVIRSDSADMGRGVLLHEIFHALQDQHFDLATLHRQSLDNLDYDKAVTAIIEGEAMLAVSERLNYNFLDHAQLPAEGIVSEQLFEKIFLYGAGLEFIQAIRDAGGWAAVNGVFQDPPKATALILNPDRYIAGERSIAPPTIPLNPGESLQGQTMEGEYALRLLLARQAATRPLLAAVAYVTDGLGVVARPSGQTVHRWVIEFDQPDIAEALADGLTTALHQETGVMPTATVIGKILTVDW